MSQSLNSIPTFDGTKYGYWKSCMRFLLTSIDIWKIVETGWTKPKATTAELSIVQNRVQLSNDKAFHALCQALSPSEFLRILNVNLLKKHGKS
jgi:hypothetical protein